MRRKWTIQFYLGWNLLWKKKGEILKREKENPSTDTETDEDIQREREKEHIEINFYVALLQSGTRPFVRPFAQICIWNIFQLLKSFCK